MSSRLRALTSAALLAALLCPAAAAEGEEGRLEAGIERARARVYPALVNIGCVTRTFRGGRAVRVLSAGSGVVVSPAGHVLTNYHVAENAVRITCTLQGGERIDADVVAHDPLTDLTVLALRMADRADPTRPVPVAPLGDSDRLRVGDHVLAMGNPQSLSSSMTLGIVANTGRVFKSFTGNSLETLDLGGGQLTGLFTRWIQHDALILGGNSGGPLVNLQGEVVGINELAGSGMGFAIPSNLARDVLSQALTFGEIRRAWLGLVVHPVEKLDREDGALVASVLPDGPAAAAGLEPGDVILRLAGEAVLVRTFEEVPGFYAAIGDLPAGTPQEVVFLRGEESRAVQATPTAMEPFRGEERAFEVWGVTAMAVTPPMAFARGYPDARGVLVTGLRPGRPAEVARPSLQRGDVVLEVGGEPVEDLETFETLQRRHARVKDLLVRFRRDRRDMVTALDMTRRAPSRRGTELAKAWLGVMTQVLTPPVARALGLEGRRGFRVTRVLPASAAEEAGLVPGDLIVALDGEALPAWRLQDAELLRRRIEDLDIGSEVVLTVVREGAEEEVRVELQEVPRPAADARQAEDEVLEYAVRELTYMDRVERDLPLETEGLVVSEVTNGGWAHVAGLAAGDLLVSLDDRPVGTIRQFKEEARRIARERPVRVKAFVRRGRGTAFVFIEPDWPPR